MKILMLTPQLPYPPHQGTSLRNYHIIRGLTRRHRITLLTFVEAGQTADAETMAPLLDLCDAVETVPAPARSLGRRLWQQVATGRPDMAHRLHSPLFNVALRDLLSRHRLDVIQVEGIELARAIAILRIVTPEAKILFDEHNAETALQRRALLADLSNPRRWPAAAYSWLQVGRLRRFERWACGQADWVTAVSEADRRHLLALQPDLRDRISVIPNCIDVQQYRSGPAATGEGDAAFTYDVLFTGKMDYRPNIDAVLWFADEVWPRIRQQRPQTTWAIVGQKPHPRLQRIREVAGVTVTGRVGSVQPYLAGAAVYVMPFRVGSGTRLKLIEAMAAGKAIVSTPVGAEGFPVQHNKQLLLAATPVETAAAVLRLLDRPEERRRLGEAAQRLAQQYDWRRIITEFEEVYRQMA